MSTPEIKNPRVERSNPYRRRLLTLAEALKRRTTAPWQTVASELYEAITGNELLRQTDPQNGEDFEYKSLPDAIMTSMAVHPEVAEYFTGWNNRFIQTEAWGGTLCKNNKANTHLADCIINEWEEFTKPF